MTIEGCGLGLSVEEKGSRATLARCRIVRAIYGVRARNGAAFTLDTVTIGDAVEFGVVFEGDGAGGEIHRSTITGSGKTGVFVGKGATASVRDTICRRNGQWGVYAEDGAKLSLLGTNAVDGNKSGQIRAPKQ